MDNTHKENLRQLQQMFIDRSTNKYTGGTKEHGGHLWRKGLSFNIYNAYDEAVDQVIYLGQAIQILKGIENDQDQK